MLKADFINILKEFKLLLESKGFLIKGCNDIPNRFFAFLLHQGYSALLFLDSEDNPIVYCYTEGEDLVNIF